MNNHKNNNRPSDKNLQGRNIAKQAPRAPGSLPRSEREYYDEIFRRAYEDGYFCGYDAGYNDGYDDGEEDAHHNEHQNEQHNSEHQHKGLKWHGKKSKSWSWL